MEGRIQKWSAKLDRYLVVMQNGVKVAVAQDSLTILADANAPTTEGEEKPYDPATHGPLRFKVGSLVECLCEDNNKNYVWRKGEVVEINFTDDTQSEGQVFPYHVKAQDGTKITAHLDVNRLIRQFVPKQPLKVYSPSDTLRFQKGMGVTCFCGEQGWLPGMITKVHIADPDVFKGRPTPYQVQLQNSSLIYAPSDDDQVIRELKAYDPATKLRFAVGDKVSCKYNNKWVRGVVSKLRYKDANVFEGKEAPYAVDLETKVTIFAPVDDDMVIKAYDHVDYQKYSLRFKIGTRVQCKCETWIPGYVVAVNILDPQKDDGDTSDTKVLPYYVQADDGVMISVPNDDQALVQELVQGQTGFVSEAGKGLRFSVGDVVECNCGETWEKGTIRAVYYRDGDWTRKGGRTVPYHIALNKGGAVLCPSDKDDTVRKVVEQVEVEQVD